MTMAWLPNSNSNAAPSTFKMIHAHMPSTKFHSNLSTAAAEQILTAPELRSMGQSDIDHDAVSGCFSTGVLLPTDDFSHSYIQRDSQYHTSPSSGPTSQLQYPSYRHSYQATTPHQQELDASRYVYMVNDFDQAIHPSMDMSSSTRGSAAASAPFRARRTQSLEIPASVSSLAVADAFQYSSFYGAHGGELTHSSLPGSPSPPSIESSPAHQATEPEYLPSLVVDGHPHPFFMPMHNTATATATVSATASSPAAEHRSANSSPSLSASPSPSPSLAFSTSFHSSFSPSSFTSASNCNSPSMPSSSPQINRKRFSTDSRASCSSIDSQLGLNYSNTMSSSSSLSKACNGGGGAIRKPKQRYVCHVPNCNRTFSRPYNLKSHGLTHDAYRPHACEKCPKTFARIHDRDRHMNSHMSQKPHECIVCLGRFARQDAVIRHLKLSNETNACSWILKAHSISFRDAAAGRVTRQALGEESKIREMLEELEERARKARATRTLELMGSAATAAAIAAATGISV